MAVDVTINGGDEWQTVVLSPGDFRGLSGDSLSDWVGIKELRITDQEYLRPKGGGKPVKLGAPWQGNPPEFRRLRWIDSVSQ